MLTNLYKFLSHDIHGFLRSFFLNISNHPKNLIDTDNLHRYPKYVTVVISHTLHIVVCDTSLSFCIKEEYKKVYGIKQKIHIRNMELIIQISLRC